MAWTLLVPAFGILVGMSACTKPGPEGFVQMKDGHMVLDGKPFFPVVVNYITDLQWHGDSCWAASSMDYQPNARYRSMSADDASLELKAEFRLMRRSGFNAVRFGLAPDPVPAQAGGVMMLPSRYGLGTDTLLPFNNEWEARYLDALEQVVGLAEEEGLKVILLLRLRPDHPEFERHAVHVLDRLRNHTGILAYDLFNEPLYFDLPHHRPKSEVHTTMDRWRKLVRKHAPRQLITIGLAGVPEVFAWDPNILDVDFISFHPYEYEPEQVRNEIRWYGEQVHTPWIIGETSLPADNDSVPYADQLVFARKTLAQTVACGGIGYSWWQFKDVAWGRFHADHMGVLNRAGSTVVDAGLPPVSGTVKPVARAFREFDPAAVHGPCVELANYRNFSSLHDAKLYGKLLDEDRKPINGGVVLAWNADWTSSYYTITKEDGSFELFGDFRFHHWMVTASCYEMQRGDCQPGAFYTGADGVASFYLGEFRLRRLPFGNACPP